MALLIKNGRIITATDDYVADIYSEGETTLPPGFTLRDEMTLVPEPAAGALQLGAILTLLHLRRRAVRHERPVDWR